MHRLTTRALLVSLTLLVGLAACTPRLSPLYHDYRAADTPENAVRDRVRAALQDAGWSLAGDDSLTVTTEARTVQHWGLYRVKVSLEVLPMGGDHVRIFFHPYRHYFTGHESTIPYLPSGVRRAIVPDLNDALEERGLTIIEETRRRDQLAGA